MRIFYAVPRSAWVDLNLRRSLEDMGHQLVPFTFPGWPDDQDPAWRARGKPRTNERLVASFSGALERGPVDLFFGYFYSSVVYSDTIERIRASGVPTVNFSCNNIHQFELVERIAPHFDLCVVPERAAVEKYRRVGARPVRIQLAANPRVYRPFPEPRRYDVTFVGQRYADRADFLVYLRRHGVQVRAWGAGWRAQKKLDLAALGAAAALLEDEQLDGVRRLLRRQLRRVTPVPGLAEQASPPTAAPPTPADPEVDGSRGPAWRSHSALSASPEEGEVAAFGGPRLLQEALIRTFSRSRISLGFATAGDSHRGPNRLTHLRLREFEAPMSGALYLTEHQDELAEYFRPGEEVLTYTDRDDLLDQVRYYLMRPEAGERVRRAGRHRALAEHTWQHRFGELFQALGLKAS